MTLTAVRASKPKKKRDYFPIDSVLFNFFVIVIGAQMLMYEVIYIQIWMCFVRHYASSTSSASFWIFLGSP